MLVLPFYAEILFSCSCFLLLVIFLNTLPISFLLLNFIIVINNSMHNKCKMKLYEKLSCLNIEARITRHSELNAQI